MRRIASLFIVAALFLTMLPTIGSAHNGPLDKLGGHFRNADCVYMLHKPTSLVKAVKTKADLLNLIKKNSSNTCKNLLTVAKIDTGSWNIPNGSSKPVVTTPSTINKKYTAKFSKCTDGDTAEFLLQDLKGSKKQIVYKTRFLYIDTPESTTQIEPYGKEAAKYTCDRLKKAKTIVLETDGKDTYDKYGRLLAWVWLDGKLFQEDITKVGLVEDFYDYGTYKYEKTVVNAMAYAKKYKKGMYKK